MAQEKKTKKKTTKKKTASRKTKKTSVKKVSVETIAEKLFDLLGIEAKREIVKDKEGVVHVQLESEDPGVLIGYHGETLASLQLILSLMSYRQTGEWVKILVNVNDYRERRQESLERMALSAAQKVKFSGEPQSLPPMPPAERRMVHLALANEEEIITESEGEDHQRRVVIKAKGQ